MRWRSNEARRLGANGEDASHLDDWATMRCCLPLNRVKIKEITDYHSFSTLVSLDVELDDREVLSYLPDAIAQGDYTGDLPTRTSTPDSPRWTRVQRKSTSYIDTQLPPRFVAAQRSESPGRPYPVEEEHSYNFNVAVLNEQASFVEALEAAVTSASHRQFRPDVAKPKLIMQVAGYDCLATDDELEVPSRAYSSSDEHDLATQAVASMRKAEKATMAGKVFGLREDEGIWREAFKRLR
jgi:sterol 3beta-glucosyltransferase